VVEQIGLTATAAAQESPERQCRESGVCQISREAAKECSPERKPWVEVEQTRAPKGRKMREEGNREKGQKCSW